MPVVIAHRGASAAHPPGNTIEAFLAAAAAGATWVELDVRPLAGGALAVHHDPLLPDGRALCEVASEDLPGWVPNLEDALEACFPLGVNVEIKNTAGEAGFDPSPDLASAVAGALRSKLGRQDLLVSSFDARTLEQFRSVAPEIPTALLCMQLGPAEVDACRRQGHVAINPFVAAVTPEGLDLARRAGLDVNVWTVDDPTEVRRLAEMGVSGIVTNRPEVACDVLARIGR